MDLREKGPKFTFRIPVKGLRDVALYGWVVNYDPENITTLFEVDLQLDGGSKGVSVGDSGTLTDANGTMIGEFGKPWRIVKISTNSLANVNAKTLTLTRVSKEKPEEPEKPIIKKTFMFVGEIDAYGKPKNTQLIGFLVANQQDEIQKTIAGLATVTLQVTNNNQAKEGDAGSIFDTEGNVFGDDPEENEWNIINIANLGDTLIVFFIQLKKWRPPKV